mgnify:CR=1 FL=1
MNQYLYRLELTRPAMLSEGPTEAESGAVSAHFAYLQDLQAKGVVLMAGRTQDKGPQTFGICVFQAESDAVAQTLMNQDPAVLQGVMRAVLFPFRIALWSSRGPQDMT